MVGRSCALCDGPPLLQPTLVKFQTGRGSGIESDERTLVLEVEFKKASNGRRESSSLHHWEVSEPNPFHFRTLVVKPHKPSLANAKPENEPSVDAKTQIDV